MGHAWAFDGVGIRTGLSIALHEDTERDAKVDDAASMNRMMSFFPGELLKH